ncbi:velvet factor-domain-containing protein [Cunninghamella echinulata]|nr:velvet factor-domain-containing protein [Cunninghamella echinulata]
MSFCTYRFTSSSFDHLPNNCYQLNLRQQPQRAKISVINERDRRTIEPPPILQLQWNDCSPDETKKRLQCPFYFMMVTLLSADTNELLPTEEYLSGSTVSSLYRLRDINDEDGGFFIFGDLYCKKQGYYKLQFSLFEMEGEQVHTRKTILSNAFHTYLPKNYPGPVEATLLSQSFSEQGVKLRLRKEHRSKLIPPSKKRKLDVKILMESQSIPKNIKSSPSPSNSLNRILITKHEPIKIAPAMVHSQYNTSNQDHHHHHSISPPSLSPSSSIASSFKDEFSLHSLDDCHLQLTATTPHSSPSSSITSSPSSYSFSSSSSLYSSSLSTPPIQKEHDHWGNHLPLLKPIMDGFTSRSAALLLPCPFDSHS